MEFAADGPMALPLWINGRAYLTVTESFLDVIDAASGEPLRRTPLCGAPEVSEAAQAALGAQAAWQALGEEARGALLSALAQALDQYTGHFAKLITQETGMATDAARDAVAAAVTALRETPAGQDGLLAVISDAGVSLAVLLPSVAAALRAGAVLVLKPSPKAPGALFALAELSARAGFPPGVVNLVHGDVAVIEALAAEQRIDRLEVQGEAAFVAQVNSLITKHRQQ